MPIPKPNSGESQQAFISRCNSALAAEFPDSEQRNAVCFKAWREKNSNNSSAFAELHGVRVFTTGRHTDSAGRTADWSINDLNAMLRHFQSRTLSAVPIKLGHTSDEFNQQVAKALGVPTSLIRGESGKGAIRLGYVTALNLNGNQLSANIKLANDAVAGLISSGYFNSVSPEIKFLQRADGSTEPVLGAISLLGAQRPALSSNHDALIKATALDDGSFPDAVYNFAIGGLLGGLAPGAILGGIALGGLIQKLASGEPLVHEASVIKALAEKAAEGAISVRDAALRMRDSIMSADVSQSKRQELLRDVDRWESEASGGFSNSYQDAISHQSASVRRVPRGIKRAEEVGSTEITWEVPVVDQETGRRQIIHHKAPVGEVAVREVVDALGSGLRQFATVLGEGTGWLAVGILGRRLLFGPAKSLSGDVRADTSQSIIGKVVSLIPNKVKRAVAGGFPFSEEEQMLGNLINSGKLSVADAAKALQSAYGYSEWEAEAEARQLAEQAKQNSSFQADADCVKRKMDEGMSEEEAKRACAEQSNQPPSNNQEESTAMATETRKTLIGALKLSEDASDNDILAAVAKLNSTAAYSEFQFAELQSQVKQLRHENRVAYYREQVRDLQGIPGTEQELADKLVKFEESGGEEIAGEVLNTWKQTSQQLREAGAFSRSLNPSQADADEKPRKDFEAAVSEYAEKNGVSRSKAYVEISKQRPNLFRAYQEAEMMVVRNGKDN